MVDLIPDVLDFFQVVLQFERLIPLNLRHELLVHAIADLLHLLAKVLDVSLEHLGPNELVEVQDLFVDLVNLQDALERNVRNLKSAIRQQSVNEVAVEGFDFFALDLVQLRVRVGDVAETGLFHSL